ncbi:hypothetical protein N8A98_00470 (plasmid) [Devosia neptuniae]|uniref:DUF3887 domain-containing protein n=1 Tax=Devosia neptuniae TaxID=191302 RepID=A0ABY6C700_9HYPH|nr:hypothetical protein [Devosia neptuniae]UXN68030.1 hypothetical protein N8A98_00470 [Devosia neptuniae]
MQIIRLLPVVRTLLVIAALSAFAGRGHAQTPETISRIIEELEFSEGYEARVDALIEQLYSKPAVWRNDANPAEVRAEALALQPQVEARLREVLAVKFYEDELQGVLDEVARTGKIDFTQEGMFYALNFEFDSAISDFVLPMIGW